MHKFSKIITLFGALVASTAAFAGVSISSPANNSAVVSSAHVSASANASRPISSISVYRDGSLVSKYSASKLDTSVSVATGVHTLTVKAWDTAGALYQSSVVVYSGDVASSNGLVTWNNIEEMSGWKGCDACAGVNGAGPSAAYWWKQHVASPSKDGDATQYYLGGSTPYANVLFSKQLVNLNTAISPIRHFVYDTDFYYTNSHAAQALEFDINQLVDGKRYIWGTQCNIRAGARWDIWDNINKHWVSTGVSCTAPPTYSWNHVTIEAERTSDNRLHYISITLNGVKHYLNKYYAPTSTTWTGITVNFQMDGNSSQEDYNVWLDNLTLKYW